MKVLWVTNIIFPHLAEKLNKELPIVGGWMYSSAYLLAGKGIDLTIATVQKNSKECFFEIKGMKYYLISSKKRGYAYDETLESKWRKIVQAAKPDLVHIHGTEYAYGLSLMKSCPELSYVISIQGLASVVGEYYTAGLKKSTIFRHTTLRDIAKFDLWVNVKRRYQKHSKIESTYLNMATDVIGRTKWDYTHVTNKNPKIQYHFCNETLRAPFYESDKWDPNSSKKHLIFLSQASYPLKGLHMVLEAMRFLKNEFPNIKIRIAGKRILKKSAGFREQLKMTGYAKYINSLLKKYKLSKDVSFIGLLNENEMIGEYLNCNVFICPSSIENSPNSLGEAQILGVPSIASSVGGIPDMLVHNRTGLLYEFEETETLAKHIRRVFTDSNFAKEISNQSIKVASKRHDPTENCKKTLSIYREIISAKK